MRDKNGIRIEKGLWVRLPQAPQSLIDDLEPEDAEAIIAACEASANDAQPKLIRVSDTLGSDLVELDLSSGDDPRWIVVAAKDVEVA